MRKSYEYYINNNCKWGDQKQEESQSDKTSEAEVKVVNFIIKLNYISNFIINYVFSLSVHI